MKKMKNRKKIKKFREVDGIELYRGLRNRIQLSKKDARVISIVSNDNNDGKSKVAYSLAESYGKTGKKVLLIDGNLRYPEISSNSQFDTDIGLGKLLKGTGNVSNSIKETDSQNLFLLPTQKSAHDSTELLESSLLQTIMDEVRNMFDMVVVDTPAINNGMDALLLSKLCDGAVYVTVENKTNTNELKENKVIFDEAGINIIGSVFRSNR